MLKIIFLCVACFFAAFIDSIAGGGGLISLPAFILAGIPSRVAIGVNKIASSSGAVVSVTRFYRNNKVNLNLVKFLIPFTILGAFSGSNLLLFINPNSLNIVFVILLFSLCIHTLVNKNLGLKNNFISLTKKTLIIGIFFAFIIGFYDGFFGPGTGSFLIFVFVKLYGYDFINANGNAKILNLTSNITALVIFISKGNVIYLYGLPCAVFMILGSNFGSKMAINNGSKFIKPIFIIISFTACVYILFK